ncbi:MAG: type II toxin-antitoxin system RelE/ParE family toxin [Bacteroidota bacterium]|nr:type II toxin-antitoxin system RelE/ParE family toxin [Bacteroidota bacterium]
MYEIILSKGTAKFLANLYSRDKKLLGRFYESFEKISKDPYCANPLVGNLKGYYSYRVGDYRIIFEIEKKRLLVFIEKIEHRKSAYK